MNGKVSIIVKNDNVLLVDGLIVKAFFSMRNRYFGIDLIRFAELHNLTIINLMNFHFPIIKVGMK